MKRHYDFSKGKRGPIVPSEPGKTKITIRIDNEVLDYFRKRCARGGNYQSLMNDALQEHIRRESLETTLRRAVRHELKEAGLIGASS